MTRKLSDVLPGLAAFRRYEATDLRHDVVAGLALSALLVPAGMGYAEVAGLPPVTGLYATIAGLLAYAVVGPSRTLILGPDSSLAPVIGAAVAPLALADTDRAVSLAGLLALMVGVILILGGLLRLGFVTDLVSKPISIGYLNGIAVVVALSQVPKLLGFSVEAGGIDDEVRGLIDGIRDGAVSAVAAGVGVGALVGIVVLREVAPRIPWMLVAVLASAVVVVTADLDVAVIGSLPGGVPAPSLDHLRFGDVFELVPAAAGIAIVAFGDSSVLSRTFSMADGHDVDKDQEMVAVGAANLACGALGGFPICASSSRTPVARESGARTQLTSVVGAAVVALLLLVAPGLTSHVPSAALAAVVIAAVLRVADVRGVVQLWSMNRTEGWLSLAAFAGVVVFGVLEGIAIAVVLSLGAFVARAWRPHSAELVRVDGRKGYHDRARHPHGRRVPGLVMVRFDAPLFFANCSFFEDVVRDTVADSPTPVRWVVIVGDPISDIDSTGAETLALLDDALAEQGVTLVFAGLKGTVKDRLARYGMAERFGPDRHYSTLGAAVSDYVRITGVDWVDWTDR
ncbi:SulP family inorganic anion transporter [Acidimicrobiia bacterium EGI L10123]|uniref:SulP family inorganic anion transporter n=1 Tax=Salinilacustrithrix flava TaxID=2957203 RepID=UPI003D7C30B7|nr:SulP family inorganic anion transporter [Acidimicrobiia bacterium EGI L10123]